MKKLNIVLPGSFLLFLILGGGVFSVKIFPGKIFFMHETNWRKKCFHTNEIKKILLEMFIAFVWT